MKKPLLLLITLFLLPAAALACTVCFGDSDSNLTRGFFWGVVVLISLPFTMMAGFATYLYLHFRKRKHERPS